MHHLHVRNQCRGIWEDEMTYHRAHGLSVRTWDLNQDKPKLFPMYSRVPEACLLCALNPVCSALNPVLALRVGRYPKPKTSEATGLPGPSRQARERAWDFAFSFTSLFQMLCVGGQIASISSQWHSRLKDWGVPARGCRLPRSGVWAQLPYPAAPPLLREWEVKAQGWQPSLFSA